MCKNAISSIQDCMGERLIMILSIKDIRIRVWEDILLVIHEIGKEEYIFSAAKISISRDIAKRFEQFFHQSPLSPLRHHLLKPTEERVMPIVIAAADGDKEGNLRDIDVAKAFRQCVQGFLVAAMELGEARATLENK